MTKRAKIKIAIIAGAVTVVGGAGTAAVYADGREIGEALLGYDEVPVLSTPGRGEFTLRKKPFSSDLQYELSYRDLESDVTQSHIHFGNEGQNGPVMIFLCTNLGNGPAGTQACPAAPATITGTITAADVGGGAAGQGIAAGEFDEVLRAIRHGATYVNVHSTARPAGEIRAQVKSAHHFWQ